MTVRTSSSATAAVLAVFLSSSAGADIVAVPAQIDLGVVPPATRVAASVWLMNDGSEPREIVAVKGGCGCMQVTQFEPSTLAPGAGLEVPFTIESAHLPVGKAPSLTVFGADDVVAAVPVRIIADETAAAPSGSADLFAASSIAGPLRVVPPTVTFGAAAVGTTAHADVWVINTSDRAIRIQDVKAGCGCTTVTGLAAGAILEPGAAQRVSLAMKAPKTIRTKRTSVRIAIGSDRPVVVPLELDAVDPRVAVVEAFHAARSAGDVDAVRALLGDDSRVWFESREGEGVPRAADGQGRWADWDQVMFATTTHGDYVVEGQDVSVEIVESNDFHRLLDRDAGHVRLTYTVDDDQRIVATLVEGIARDESTTDRLPQFLTWAREHHPEEIAAIYPDNRLVPSRDNARVWRQLLQTWRKHDDAIVATR